MIANTIVDAEIAVPYDFVVLVYGAHVLVGISIMKQL